MYIQILILISLLSSCQLIAMDSPEQLHQAILHLQAQNIRLQEDLAQVCKQLKYEREMRAIQLMAENEMERRRKQIEEWDMRVRHMEQARLRAQHAQAAQEARQLAQVWARL